MKVSRYLILGASTLLTAQVGYALELSLTSGVEAEWTDNVFRSNGEKRSDLLETIRLGAQASEEDNWFQLNLDYRADYERYDRKSYAAETYYAGNASLLLIPFPDRFDWRFEVQSATTSRDSILPNTPDNRDQRNTYTTTPRLILVSLARDTVSLSGNASRTTYRDAEHSDSDRAGGYLTWEHRLSQLTSFNVVAGHDKVNFDVAEDYERDYYRLGVTRLINHGSIAVSAGQTRLKPEVSDESKGVNYGVHVTWGEAAHTLQLDIVHDISDTSEGMDDGVGSLSNALSPTDVNTGEVEVVTRTRIVLTDIYRISSATTLTGNIYTDKEKAEAESAFATNRLGGIIALTLDLLPDLRGEVEGEYEKAKTGAERIEVDTFSVRFSLTRNFGENVALAGWVERLEANGDSGAANYDAHQVGISLTANF